MSNMHDESQLRAPINTQASDNPISSLSGAHLQLRVPKRMTVRLTDTSKLVVVDLATLFFTVVLSLAIGFGTAYFSAEPPRPNSLKYEFLGWVVISVALLVVILISRAKLYLEATELISYRVDREQAPNDFEVEALEEEEEDEGARSD
jgi:hypothetical protein